MAIIKDILKPARLEYRNSRGKRLNQKYVVIESDDWGSIRQSSREAWITQMKKSSRTKEDLFFIMMLWKEIRTLNGYLLS